MERHKLYRIGTLLLVLLHIKIRICHADSPQIDKCTLSAGGKDRPRELELLRKLDPLKGNIFTAKDKPEGSSQGYVYKVGICTHINTSQPTVGAIQYKEDGSSNPVNLGLYNETQVLGGTNWIMLIYKHGDTYPHSCNGIRRRIQLMIVCDPDEEKGTMQIIEERKKGDVDCMYLFELNNKVACTPTHHEEGLSSGSVFCILFFTVAGLYFCLGFLYQRIVVGAKGLEQIPNYNFWKEVGYLEADGCDFVCRCGPRYEPHQYRGIGDHLSREEETERDDQLLTM